MRVSSTQAVIAAIAALLTVFILIPIGSVLIQSLSVDIPLHPHEMRERVEDALQLMPLEQRRRFLRESTEQLDPNQAMEATAATLAALGFGVPWDRKAPYAEQIAAAQSAVAKLSGDQRLLFEREYQLQVIVTHKKIPLAFMVKDRLSKGEFESLRSGQTKGFSFEYYRQFLNESRYLKATLHSLFLAVHTCAITVPLAFLLAFGVNRKYIRHHNIVQMVILAPLVSPPVIMAFAAILLLGRQGLITHGLLDKSLGWINSETTNIYGMGGVVLAMTLSYLPHAFIVLDDVMKRHDGRLEEAAAAHGADGFTIFRKVTLPMSRPGLVRAALVVFILSMTDFGNPLVIGRGYSVLSGVIYDEIIGFQNMSLSSALCVWLVIPALMAFLLFEFSSRRKRFSTQESGISNIIPELEPSRWTRVFLSSVASLVCLAICLFYGVIVMGSFTRVWGMDFTFTLDHYRLHSEINGGIGMQYGIPLIWNSVRVAGPAAIAGGILSISIAFLTERVRFIGANAIYFFAMLPAVVPGVILGVGYLVAFNQPFGANALALTGTGAILVLNILFANLYVGVMAGRATLQRIDPAIDEAAQALGATVLQGFRRVSLPILRHVYILATLYIFIHGMMTLSAVIFLVSPQYILASVGIFLNAEGGRYGLACSVTVIALLLVGLIMGLISWSEQRWNAKRSTGP